MQNYNLNEINNIPNNTSGVYAIINMLNNHKYVGSSKDIKKRLYQHRCKLNNNTHHSVHLQRAFNTSVCSNIVQCAKGNKKQAFGFKWKYSYDK